MAFRVLNARSDAAEWHEVLLRMPVDQRDIYFTPEWLVMHATAPSVSACLYVYEQGQGILAYPFLLRELTRVGECTLPQPTADIESAYGYGGPIATGVTRAFLAQAWKTFAEWCLAHRVVAEFVRLHPLLDNGEFLPEEMERSDDRETVSIDLAEIAEGRQPYSARARSMIRQAVRGGANVIELPGSEASGQFQRLYEATMRRLGAHAYYLFDDRYFQCLGEIVETRGVLLGVEHDSNCVAAAVFLKGSEWMHCHLAATDRDRQVPGTMNLLFHEAARLGASQGLTRLHIGGGTTRNPEDPLLLFKRSMGTGRHLFRIGKRVHNKEKYEELGRLWRQEHGKSELDEPSKLLFYHDNE
jgi:hypothetical protein